MPRAARNDALRLGRPPRACFVFVDRSPAAEDGVDDAPLRFHHVFAGEEGGVAFHGVQLALDLADGEESQTRRVRPLLTAWSLFKEKDSQRHRNFQTHSSPPRAIQGSCKTLKSLAPVSSPI